jgi:hypothetical protein
MSSSMIFFEDELTLDSMTLILDADDRFSIKHHKQLDDFISSIFIHPNPWKQMHPKLLGLMFRM